MNCKPNCLHACNQYSQFVICVLPVAIEFVHTCMHACIYIYIYVLEVILQLVERFRLNKNII